MASKLAHQIVQQIIDDLNDRRGLHIDSLDRDIQAEIRLKWRSIVDKAIRDIPSPAQPKER